MERKGIRSKEAIREVANERGLSRRDVYKEFHVEVNELMNDKIKKSRTDNRSGQYYL